MLPVILFMFPTQFGETDDIPLTMCLKSIWWIFTIIRVYKMICHLLGLYYPYIQHLRIHPEMHFIFCRRICHFNFFNKSHVCKLDNIVESPLFVWANVQRVYFPTNLYTVIFLFKIFHKIILITLLTKLRPYEAGNVWLPTNNDPTNKNDSIVSINLLSKSWKA